MPISVPSTEPRGGDAHRAAGQALRASAWPSRQDAAEAGVPGMLSRIAEREPP